MTRKTKKRIGELLVERGLLTPSQLGAALRAQLVFGGQLGTCLIELGHLDELTFGKALSEIISVPLARQEVFDDIPPEVLDALPEDLVVKYRAVPFGIEGRSLHVAVVDPGNLATLSVRSGYKIVPYVAPEMRVFEAMERYYGIPRRRRYIRMERPARRAGARDPIPVSPRTDRRPRTGPLESTLRHLGAQLSTVVDSYEVGQAVIDYTEKSLPRALFFEVANERVRLTHWRGDLAPERIDRLGLDLTPESIFALAAGEWCYRGPLPSDVDAGRFYAELGNTRPGEVLILPIYGDEKLDAILYGDSGGPGGLGEPTESYLELGEKIALALKVLEIRSRLCA